jgi:hypothetical protein
MWSGIRRRKATSAVRSRAAMTSSGEVSAQASGRARDTIAGWKLKKTALTSSGEAAPSGADREAK